MYKTIDYAKRKARLEIVEELMTPGCFKKMEKDYEAGSGFQNLNPLDFQGVQIEKVGEEGTDDFIDLRFLSERDKNMLIEHYRFTRPRYESSSSLTDPLTRGDACPHCGARITDNDQWQCDFCGTILTGQSVGWTIVAMWKEGEYPG